MRCGSRCNESLIIKRDDNELLKLFEATEVEEDDWWGSEHAKEDDCFVFGGLTLMLLDVRVGNLTMEPASPLIPRMPPKK